MMIPMNVCSNYTDLNEVRQYVNQQGMRRVIGMGDSKIPESRCDMKLSSVEAYLEWDSIDTPDKREWLHQRFPYVVVVEEYYPEKDYTTRWCWQKFGPPHGECFDSYSEYPACPLVLALMQSGDGDSHLSHRRKYDRPEAHSHIGTWTTFWLGKTDYDYGFEEYCFAKQADYDAFLAAVPTFGWGEHF
jgi:hypothetical protein